MSAQRTEVAFWDTSAIDLSNAATQTGFSVTLVS